MTIADLLDKVGFTLRAMGGVNVILGKNGCGKSTLLKAVETTLSQDDKWKGRVRYITPERGGKLTHDPNVESNIVRSDQWLAASRRVNQFTQFREQSVVQYRKLELLCLREIETTPVLRRDLNHTFETTISKINSLLDNVEIRREDSDFNVYTKADGNKVTPDRISSGESELITLAIECLSFEKECVAGEGNILFLDEPDVHLHPDLQVRFVQFLRGLVGDRRFQVVVATHSTAFLGALRDYGGLKVAFMGFGDKELRFEGVSPIYQKILPVFGAHPLSNIFNEAPILLVEGEDDERIWQQAVRSGDGRILVYPCPVDGVDNMRDYEDAVRRVMGAVYDSATAYSLRDRDDTAGTIQDLPPLKRFRLACRSSENLLLSDDVLSSLGTTWDVLKQGIEKWIKDNPQHPHYEEMVSFKEAGFPRKTFALKSIRNDLMGIIGSPKPWEVAVGQAIPSVAAEITEEVGSLASYLGADLIAELLRS